MVAENPANRGKSRILDPRANAVQGGAYQKYLAAKEAERKANYGRTMDPGQRGGTSSVAVRNLSSGFTKDPGQRGFQPRQSSGPDVTGSFYSPSGITPRTVAKDPVIKKIQQVYDADLLDQYLANSGNVSDPAKRGISAAMKSASAGMAGFNPNVGGTMPRSFVQQPGAASDGMNVNNPNVGVSLNNPSMYGPNPQMPTDAESLDTIARVVANEFGAGADMYNPPYPDPPVVQSGLSDVDKFLRDLSLMTEKERIDLAKDGGAFDSEQDYLDALAGKGTWVKGDYTPAGVDAGVDMGVDKGVDMGVDMGGMGDMGVVGGGSPLDRQINIVETALSEREAAIQDMVDAGVIDIQAAQALYDTERERVYEDFIAEQAGVITGFEDEMAAAQAERTADRNALNAQLIAAGIDPALVADEFAMMDATYQGGRDAERDYLDALGRIGTSADADRALLGEAVFGGFGQDLRSTGREMGLNAAMLAAQDRQTARERGLSSELLSPFTGVPEGAMFAGQYADVDTPGIREGRLQRAESARQFDEALLQREAESALDRAQLQRDKAVDDERFRIQMMSEGIDPDTGEYLRYDPNNPYAGLTPAQRFEAQRTDKEAQYEDQLPLTTFLPMAISSLPEVEQQAIMDAITANPNLNFPQSDAQLGPFLAAIGAGGLMQELLNLQGQYGRDYFANLSEEDAAALGTMSEIVRDKRSSVEAGLDVGRSIGDWIPGIGFALNVWDWIN